MCLLSNNPPAKTTQDITVYKVVIVKERGRKYPPFEHYAGHYTTWPNLISKEEPTKEIEKTASGKSYVYGKGYIHALTSEFEAKNLATWLMDIYERAEVWKGIIPKGELYAQDGTGSICATRINITDKVAEAVSKD